jgi:hypothetical protein
MIKMRGWLRFVAVWGVVAVSGAFIGRKVNGLLGKSRYFYISLTIFPVHAHRILTWRAFAVGEGDDEHRQNNKTITL